MSGKTESLVGLRRGFEILEFLAGNPTGLSFNELRDLLEGVSPSTLSRLLKAMREEELLEHEINNRRYFLGERAKAFAESSYASRSKLVVIQAALNRLALQSKASSAYFEWDADATLLIAKHDLPEAFSYTAVGKRAVKIYEHGFGKVCLAYLSTTERHKVFKQVDPPEDIDMISFNLELEKIKSQNLLVNTIDDQEGLKRIVAPVFNGDGGDFAGAIGISFFRDCSTKSKQDELSEPVIKAALEIGNSITNFN